jgi:DNA-binding MarR family transcriptional regulator
MPNNDERARTTHMMDQGQEALRNMAKLIAAYLKELKASGLTDAEALYITADYQKIIMQQAKDSLGS